MKTVKLLTLSLLLPAFAMTACGDKNKDTPTPEPTMRYVSRIDGLDGSYEAFEYDSKNRVNKVTAVFPDGQKTYTDVMTFVYDETAKTLTVTTKEDGDKEGDENVSVFKLNADGSVASCVEGSCNVAFTYVDGYFTKSVSASKESSYTHTVDATWSGGNMSTLTHGGTDSPHTAKMTYNAEWPNNPLCNLDLNGFSIPYYMHEGDNSMIEWLGLMGKRSKNMISGYTETRTYGGGGGSTSTVTSNFKVTAMEYDKEGFVTKISVSASTEGAPAGSSYSSTATITYR